MAGALHSAAYVSWPIALLHGLNAGRPPATWVVVSYLACVFLVVAAMLVRLSVSLGRKRTERGQTTSAIKPVGRVSENSGESRNSTAGMSRRRPRARGSREKDWFSGLHADLGEPMLDSWASAGEAPVRETWRRPSNRFTVPEVPRSRPEMSYHRLAEEGPVSGPRHSRRDDDETPTLVNLASRRALRAAEGGSARARRKRTAAEVDGAYWTRLRGEAQ